MLADNGGRLLRPTGRSYDSLLMSGCGQTRNNPSGTKAGFTNDWMGIIGEIRVPPPGIGEAAKSRWLRTQHVNRVLPLTLTLKIGLSNRVVSLNQAAESTPGQQFNLKQSQLAMALIDLKHLTLRLGRHFSSCEDPVLPNGKLKVDGIGYFFFDCGWGEFLPELTKLALCRVERVDAPQIEDVDPVLALPSGSVAL